MRHFLRYALAARRLPKGVLRRGLLLAAFLLFACGAFFGIGQLQAFQSMPPTKPFHYAGNHTGILLVHGFGGAPTELQPLATRLAQKGYTVSTPLLPGHGTTPRDFAATSNEELMAALRCELETLRPHCDRIFVVGFSMGGLLALQMEQEEKIDGLILMSTPIQPWNDFAQFHLLKVAATGATRIHLFVPTLGIPKLVTATRRGLGDVPANVVEPNYAAYPAASCLRVLELIQEVKPELSAVTTPTLIFHSRDDRVSAPSSAQYLFDHLGSNEKQLVYLQNSGHVIALGKEREKIAELVEEFVATGTLHQALELQ